MHLKGCLTSLRVRLLVIVSDTDDYKQIRWRIILIRAFLTL